MLTESWTRLRQNSLAQNLLAAAGGKLLFFGASFVRNLLLAKLIGPINFGVWNLGLVFLQYAQWSHFSILNAFRLDGARSRGAGEIVRLQKLRRLTWTACMGPSFVVTLATAAVALWIEDTTVRDAVLMLSALLLPYQLYTFANAYLGTEERFLVVGQVQAAYAVLNLALTLGLAFIWGFWGALMAQVLSYGLILFFYRRHFALVLAPLFDWSLICEQLRLGLPIGLAGVVYTLFITIDRTLVASVLGMAALGQYGLTMLARSSIGLIPDAISEVIYMRISTQYGQTKRVDTLLPMILRTDLHLACLTGLAIGLVVIWMPWAVQTLLPDYMPGVTTLQVFLVGLFFTFPIYVGVLLTSIGRAADLLPIYGFVITAQVFLIYHWIRAFNIVGVAVATATSSALLFLLMNIWGLRRVGLRFRKIGIHILECLLPLAGMLAGISLGSLLLANLSAVTPLWIHPLAMSGVFLAFNLPLSCWGFRRHPENDLQEFTN